MNFIKNLFKKKPIWVYGYCKKSKARKHRIKGNVQFIMWKAGEQGHVEDFWLDMNDWWWPCFTVEPVNCSKECNKCETRNYKQ